MTKAEIVREISLQTAISEVEVSTIINQFLNVVKNAVKSKNNVSLRGFGTFMYRVAAEKIGRNILKGNTVTIPAHGTVKFKPSAELKNALK